MQTGYGFLSRLKLGTCSGLEIREKWMLLTSNRDIHLSLVEVQHCNTYLEQNLDSLTFQTHKLLKGCYWYKMSRSKAMFLFQIAKLFLWKVIHLENKSSRNGTLKCMQCTFNVEWVHVIMLSCLEILSFIQHTWLTFRIGEL